jgi:hypothetical protein
MTKREWSIAASVAVETCGWVLIATGHWLAGALLVAAGILPWGIPGIRSTIASERARDERRDAG